MPFSLGWVDHDQGARDRIHEILAHLREPGVRDELGIGTIRDSFASLLFPGTSTVQTRLRYFLIVPWVYRSLEEGGAVGGEIWRMGEELEREVAKHLALTREKGVIGKRGGRRLASSVYWTGLGAWGLRHEPGGRNGSSIWHRGLPLRPSGFPEFDTLALTAREAEYIRDRVAQAVPGSLLAHLFLHPRSVKCGFAWEHPDYEGFSSSHKETLQHARLFSEVIDGALLLYSLLLARRAGREEKVGEYQLKLETWSTRLDGEALRNWSLPDFWMTVRRGRRINPSAQHFVGRWIDYAKSGALNAANHGFPGDNSAPARLVRRREKALKRLRSRFSNQRMLDEWNGGSGVYRMGYRWYKVRGYLDELVAGLSRG
ncbi:MAG: DUF6361 family protein [Gammaproteobacteria bacterium]|nr:DUF6361 family protein [Gammaproteobacteria bacterium]MDE2880421.1 DUF6361 family protein [Acidobacteriota bacterium]